MLQITITNLKLQFYNPMNYLTLASLLTVLGLAAPTPPKPQPSLRETLVTHALRDVGVVEATGRNDGRRVEEVIRKAGGSKGEPYCAYAVYTWGLESLGSKNPFPKTGWSPKMVANPTWTRAKGGPLPRRGDTFGIYMAHLGRIGHTGLVVSWGNSVVTMEGNTGPNGSVAEADRNGDGFRSKRRMPGSITQTKSWLP